MTQQQFVQYAPRCKLELDIPKFGTRDEFVQIYPAIEELKWTRNHHLVADEVTATVSWKEGGADPRILRSGRVSLWVWDEELGEFDDVKHLRFTGIVVKSTRRSTESGMSVDITAHDYTSMFLNMKPFPSSGMPEWSDTLETIWQKICDNTGYWDGEKIVSNVAIFRDRLRLLVPEAQGKTLGELVPQRFHAISKPHPPGTGQDAWAIWQWCVGSLGLISYIDRDECIVTNSTEHYETTDGGWLVWGENIDTFEETSDATVSQKGVLVKSFDPLTGRVLEAVYPKPGDERLKVKRAVAKRALKEARDPSINELSADYMEFELHGIINQEALEKKAQAAYEEFSRQELNGTLSTAEMRVQNLNGDDVDLLDLRAGDPIVIGVRDESLDDLRRFANEAERVRYLVDHCNYNEDLAHVIAKNIDNEKLANPVFHVSSLDLELGQDKFNIQIKYHNLIIPPQS